MRKILRVIDGCLLEVPPCWDGLTIEDRARLCNGVGPDEWPAWRRHFIGHLAPWMVPASKPHDVRYAAPLTLRQRYGADCELLRNWYATIRQRLDWTAWDWFVPIKREEYLLLRAIAKLSYRAVRISGGNFADAKGAK